MSKNVVDLKQFEELMVDNDEFENFSMNKMIFDMVHGNVNTRYGGDYINKETAQKLFDNGYKPIEQDGGGEGGGEYCYGVFQFGEKFFKAEYSYYSYHGFAIDDIESTLKEVKPVEKVVTVYE